MDKKKHLLPQVPRYFKANLHTHTTISDGKLSPEETKAAYKAKGYQILCLTDHQIIADHSAMNEPDFLMLTGLEMDYNHDHDRPITELPVYHLNLIAKRPDNLWTPGRMPRANSIGSPYAEKMQCEAIPVYYDTKDINAMIAKANEMGFLVSYNHPTWSCQSYPDYAPLKGLWAMELRNSECCCMGINENNARVFKDMLNLGNRIYPLGTDDMHTYASLGQSWIMVGAEKLEYDSVITALENGDFYMSCGPEISNLAAEGNSLHISCSGAKCIILESNGRFSLCKNAEGGHWLQNTTFDISDLIADTNGAESTYVYLTVIAPDGTYATTRAYYLCEFL